MSGGVWASVCVFVYGGGHQAHRKWMFCLFVYQEIVECKDRLLFLLDPDPSQDQAQQTSTKVPRDKDQPSLYFLQD